MKCMKPALAGTLLLLVATAYGQQPQLSAPPGGAPMPPDGVMLPADDGIPQIPGFPDEDGPAFFDMSPPRFSDLAPRPPADPRNFEGTWIHRNLFQGRIVRNILGSRLPYTDEARDILKWRREMEIAGKPVTNAAAKCYPSIEFALEVNPPFYIIQEEDSIYFVFEEFHDIWQIRLNQQHQLTEPGSFKGDSIGYWDGNTLVIETLGYREPLWLDAAGTPASENARITRRMRKIEDGSAFEIITTIDDPQMYTETWSYARTFRWAPDKWMLGEYNCEQQQGGTEGASSYGVVDESEEEAGSR